MGTSSDAIEPLLARFATKQGLYLDRKGKRPARKGKKVSWKDDDGNVHDLDFVLERGGTAEKIGVPAAFIEVAWRRYTKHSRNKAQEIQGAILPLVRTYRQASPFYGAIIAGEFTDGALTQLSSVGFRVLYFPYDSVVSAFARVGIDARSEETTEEAEFAEKVEQWVALGAGKQRRVATALLKTNAENVRTFIESLEGTVTRRLEAVRVVPLHGNAVELRSPEEAIAFIEAYDDKDSVLPVLKYEIQLRYNNGDRIDAQFEDKASAIQFLGNYVHT